MFCRFAQGGFGSVGYGFGGAGVMMMILFLAILAFAVYFMVKTINRRSSGSVSHFAPQPIEILNERLAKGDISEEEYESIRKRMIR